jgi:tRNA threonylcarbamoyladenosine modification (KEOPS) complex Cgi121 subunit
MENDSQTKQSLFLRTFTKEEALARERYLLIENSDVPANRVSIENAVNKAIKEMEEQLDFYSRTKKE